MFRILFAVFAFWATSAAATILMCEGEEFGGITVSLVDAQSDMPLRIKCEDSVSVADGEYVEVLEGIGNCSMGSKEVFGDRGRPGTYTLTVKKRGYRVAEESGIEHFPNVCDLLVPKSITVRLTAE